MQSTSAATALEEDSTATDSESSSEPPPHQSRLKALRERLQNEDTTNQQLSFAQAKKSKPAPQQQDSSLPPDHTTDLINLLNQLDTPAADHVLVDSFARQHTYLRLSLTERCNLRCTYCMPEAGVPLQPASHLLQTAELLELAGYFSRAGVTKFRLTGGEPTLRGAELADIVAGLHALEPESIGMTTNGVTLTRYLPDLLDAGLSNINVSLDTLKPEKFEQLTRRPASYLKKVWQSLERAVELQVPNLKVNCVVMRGINDGEVADFCRLTEQYPSLQVRFIEYMPFSENGWNWDQCVPYKELLENVAAQDEAHDNPIGLTASPSPDPHDTTKWYTTATGGRVGFITSMSSHFCAGCNRLRLTADGQIKVCLFDGATEVSLRDALRLPNRNKEEDLNKLVHLALSKKHFSLGGHKNPQDIMQDSANNRPMTLIGG